MQLFVAFSFPPSISSSARKVDSQCCRMSVEWINSHVGWEAALKWGKGTEYFFSPLEHMDLNALAFSFLGLKRDCCGEGNMVSC